MDDTVYAKLCKLFGWKILPAPITHWRGENLPTACVAIDPNGIPRAAKPKFTVDELVRFIEKRRLGWSLDYTGNLVEARVWDWPYVIGRHRPCPATYESPMNTGPLADMLSKAMMDVDWSKYPEK